MPINPLVVTLQNVNPNLRRYLQGCKSARCMAYGLHSSSSQQNQNQRQSSTSAPTRANDKTLSSLPLNTTTPLKQAPTLSLQHLHRHHHHHHHHNHSRCSKIRNATHTLPDHLVRRINRGNGQLSLLKADMRKITYSQMRAYFLCELSHHHHHGLHHHSTRQYNARPLLLRSSSSSLSPAHFPASSSASTLFRHHQSDMIKGWSCNSRRYATKHDKYINHHDVIINNNSNISNNHNNHASAAGPRWLKRDSSTFKDSIFFKSDGQQQQLSVANNSNKDAIDHDDGAGQHYSSHEHDSAMNINDVDGNYDAKVQQQQHDDKTTPNNRNVITANFVHRNDQISHQQSNQQTSTLLLHQQDPADESTETAEDLIFDMFNNGNDGIKIKEFLSSLSAAGLHYDTDPRLKEFKKNLKALRRDEGPMSKKDFKQAIKPNIVLISRAMRGDFVIPDWTRFTKTLEEFYWRCRINKNGNVANYIPQLAKYNPDYWGVSMCSIDGQRYHCGDVDVPFTIQSSGKPINYAIALNELGSATTHKYVGQEPSGRLFNDLSLKIFDDSGHPKPHNPMVNSGAIVTCSLLMKLIKPEMRSSEKFDWVCDFYKSMAGGEYIGFSNATFLSEREAADRNYAIGFYMRENKCFPEDTNLQQVMDFYFQLCSLEVNCKTVSMIAATLANGGICPITEKKVIDSRAVRNVLSLMHSCGMYDYSGQFAFYVGLPAKSGVSGCTLVVIPNVGGLGLFSPPLDTYGNSVRSLQFCHELVDQFNFHQYDNLRHVPHKSDPRRKKYETLGLNIICLLFAAAKGDMSAIRRYYMSGMDMSLSDYDHRTALHAAAAEGNLEIIEFLLQVANVNHEPRDRWGRRPIDDASYCGHSNVVDFLKAWPQIKNRETNR